MPKGEHTWPDRVKVDEGGWCWQVPPPPEAGPCAAYLRETPERAAAGQMLEALKAIDDEAVFLNGLASSGMAADTVERLTDGVRAALAAAEREKG